MKTNLPKFLYDLGGKINANVGFSVKPDNSGIDLVEFGWEGSRINVLKVIAYEPYRFGIVNPGAGQIGIYGLIDGRGRKHIGKIYDYRADEGDWRIQLLDLRGVEQFSSER